MKVRIEPSWGNRLEGEFSQPYFEELTEFVRKEYAQNVCYPIGKNIFRAFDLCRFDDLKVVILGQDPYHEPGQAHGLCFSVGTGVTIPPSLRNIFSEVSQDVGSPVPSDGDLSRWARQGVLLLNATLTVREHQAGSHQGKGWEHFTDAVISLINSGKSHVVFMLWGNYARSKARLIDESRHLVLQSVHPSPLSAGRGGWFGNHHFSKANEFLKSNGMKPIEW